MPMPISSLEEYDKIIDVGWYTPERDREDITYVVSAECMILLMLRSASLAFYRFLKCTLCAALISEIS